MTRSACDTLRPYLAGTALLALAACSGSPGFDWDLRPGDSASTTEAARQATAERPQPDARGVISYPGYQVVVARRGETVSGVAQRLGLNSDELARYNALPPDTELRQGEVLALSARVDAGPAGTAGPRPGSGGIDVASIATTAIDRASGNGATRQPAAAQASGPEPIRHQVVRGETAFSIARLYNVSTRALADWNGLGADMVVREGQYLMIPVAAGDTRTAAAAPPVTPPGGRSPTPEPPSAARPLPQGQDPAASVAAATPPSPDLGAQRTEPQPAAQATGSTRLAFPVQGSIIREYQRGRNDGISISAAAGSPVRAADSGTVAAITRDTDQMPILVIRHANNLLTVYANIDNIQVERGAQVSRGDTIASVRAGDPAFIHFEVRQGFDSVDPMTYLQ